MTRRIALTLAFVVLLVMAAKPVWDSREQWHWGRGFDDGVYWVTAKSLAVGSGYRVLSLPGEPHAVKYPPLYPLYLSLAWRLNPVFPGNLKIAAAMQALLLPIYLALLLKVLRGFGFSWRRTFLVAALSLATLQFMLLVVVLLSELLCLCFLLAAILALERASHESPGAAHWWALAGGLLAGLAYLTRNASLPLFAAIPIFFALRKRSRLSVYALAAALPFAAAWHGWAFLHHSANFDPGNTSYFQEYLQVIRAGGGFWQGRRQLIALLSATVADSFFPGLMNFLHGIPLHHLVLITALSGAIRIGRVRQWPLFLIFSALYLVLIVVWWSDGLVRLMLPAWPVLVAGIAQEATYFTSLCAHSLERLRFPMLTSRAAPTWKQALHWILLALGVWIAFRSDRLIWNQITSVMAAERQLRLEDEKVFSWLTAHAQPETVVVAWKDSVTYLYTGLPSSHSLFVAVTPQQSDVKALGASFSTVPSNYRRGLFLILRSDLGYEGPVIPQLTSLRQSAERLADARLEFSSESDLVYSFALRQPAEPH